MQNWLVWASEANGNVALSQLSLPMKILDRNRHVVYDSALAARDAMLRFTLINDDPRLAFRISRLKTLPLLRACIPVQDWSTILKAS